MASDPAKRREAGVIGYLDRHYQKLGMKLVSTPINGTYGFRYFLKEPIIGEPSFAGRKIRGTVSYHPMIEALGGIGVVMGGGDVYSALQTGVLDGAAWSLTGALDFKWYEVASHMADPVFGQVGTMILMNLDAWEALTLEEQQAIDRAAARLEAGSVDRFDLLAENEKNALIEKGMKLTQFPAAEAGRLNELFSEGVWKVAANGAPDEARELRALGAKAGLTAAAD
jgi:TRAP-type C4-dicarboxylate transport system substrate-binding protein